MKIVN